jgi:hypothetical protein
MRRRVTHRRRRYSRCGPGWVLARQSSSSVRDPDRHSFRVVEHLLTNFHLPEPTLLMLVCAFASTERVLAAYRHAVAERYRFFSFGGAMLLHRAR